MSARFFFIHTKAEATHTNQSHCCARTCMSLLVLLVTLPTVLEAHYVILASLFPGTYPLTSSRAQMSAPFKSTPFIARTRVCKKWQRSFAKEGVWTFRVFIGVKEECIACDHIIGHIAEVSFPVSHTRERCVSFTSVRGLLWVLKCRADHKQRPYLLDKVTYSVLVVFITSERAFTSFSF